MSKSDFSQSLLASSSKPQTAADKIPIIARFAVSERAKETLNLVGQNSSLRFDRWVLTVPAGRKICRRRMHPLGHRIPLSARRRSKEMDHLPSHHR